MRVELLSSTENPIVTILDIWDLSKSPLDMDHVRLRMDGDLTDNDLTDEDIELFRRIMAQEIPVTEHVTFNFIVDDAPISWREQAVRHRVGFKKGDNYAVDMFPDDGATFWSQSMRLLDMSRFAENGAYHTPESVMDNDVAYEVYHTTMADIGSSYAELIRLGVPMEDARSLIPMAATSRLMMTVNLRALQHIVGKRGCWILQSSLWAPLIHGVIGELAEQIHPVFRELAHPPCVRGGKFVECVFKLENERRLPDAHGIVPDPLPVCPLYWTSERHGDVLATNKWPTTNPEPRIPEYAELWNQPHLLQNWEWENR